MEARFSFRSGLPHLWEGNLMLRFLSSAMILLAVSPFSVVATEWPQFRGPRASGVTESKHLPDNWSRTHNVAWKTEIPGRGWSSPIIWGDRVFLTTVTSEGKLPEARKGLYFGGEQYQPPTDKHRWLVLCLDLNGGKILWEREVHQGVPPATHHVKNSYASETPATDGERIYAYFGNVGLFCLDFQGKVLWQQKWPSVKTRLGWGTAASPTVHQDQVFVVNDNEEKSFLVSLDKRTGKEIWRVDRDEKSNWATPFIWENERRTELVTPGRSKVRSYSLDGKLLWEFSGMSSITIPTPLSEHGLLYVSSGYVGDRLRPIFAVRPGAGGDISLKDEETSNEHIAWSNRTAGPYNPSPIVYGDLLYVLYDRGFLAAYDARTGKEVYPRKRLDPSATAFTASPWAYQGKIFCLSEDGDTFVVQAGLEFRVLGKNSLDALCMATPAISGNNLLIRTATELYCLRREAK